MPHTYSNLWFHLVFGTKERRPHIAEAWRPRLHEYLDGTIRGLDATALEVGGVEDHVHLLVRLKPVHRIDYFLRDLKADSSGWIHKQRLSAVFTWQRGYGAFTVSESQIGNVRRYIANQEEHHRRWRLRRNSRRCSKRTTSSSTRGFCGNRLCPSVTRYAG